MKRPARWLIVLSALSVVCSDCLAADAPGFDIQLDTISSGFDKKSCWVHPRAGAIPGETPIVVLTMLKAAIVGSDIYGALHEMRTDDLGTTWSGPVEHALTLGRRNEPDEVVVTEIGNELRVDADRGLVEPSLTRFKGRYYLTLRHDKLAYVSTGEDGLHFSEPRQWLWDDGTDLGSYNTQAHWVTHDDALFLVYTRRGANNDHIPRHRAPLFMAQVDPETLRVLRATERELMPQRGAKLGNFGVTEVNAHETWVTDAEWMQTTPPNPSDFAACMKYGSDNAVFVARIRWKVPNTSWSQR